MNEENIRTEITWHGRKVRIIAVSTRQKIFIFYIVMQDSIHYSLFITYKRKIHIQRDVLLAERSIRLSFCIIDCMLHNPSRFAIYVHVFRCGERVAGVSEHSSSANLCHHDCLVPVVVAILLLWKVIRHQRRLSQFV